MATELSDTVTTRALGILVRRLEQHPLNEHDELVARASYLDGFRDGYRRGGRDALDECTHLTTVLADRSFRTALAQVIQFIDARVEP